jgi:CelD/BcsL family acetyltransferase involved in cellulose biosynthesis
MGDAEPLASMFELDFANKIHLYNSGFNPEHRDLAPGVVLLAHCIQNAIGLRRQEYDFLRGKERYKYDLGGQDRAVMKVEYTPPPPSLGKGGP